MWAKYPSGKVFTSCSFSPPSWSYDQAKLLSVSFSKVEVFKQTVNSQFEGNFYI